MSPAATGPHVDETGARGVGEVGLLEYDDCQVSAIHGLRDVFRVAPPRRRQSVHQEFTPQLQHGGTDIREMRAQLHACLHEPHSVEHLAQTAAMPPRTFQRRFQEATGLTAPDTSRRRASRRSASCRS